MPDDNKVEEERRRWQRATISQIFRGVHIINFESPIVTTLTLVLKNWYPIVTTNCQIQIFGWVAWPIKVLNQKLRNSG